ncbi:hypothetical protein MED297_10181 [Reinekea sp. MED297]|uniref:DUF3857 domain-containing protein n=2 Tax=Reinekea TaxID=230494 RepID=A4BAB4_9GAMM|nr:hypothetical protein MED297_10181 [Reinekea sp. MED297] [Reinekea blandensis MED297]
MFALLCVWLMPANGWASVVFPMDSDALIARAKLDQQEQVAGYDEVTNVLRRIVVDVDGNKVTRRIQALWFYPDTSSVEEYGTESIYFDDVSESVRVHTAATLSPDGTVSQFDPANAQYGDSDQYNTFSNGRVLYLALPGMQANGYTVLDYEITSDLKLTETPFADHIRAESLFPLRQFELIVRAPTVTLNWDNSHPAVYCESLAHETRCSGQDIPALQFDSTTYWRDKLRGVSFAVNLDWSELAAHALTLYQNAFTEQSEVESLYQRLVDGIDSKAQRIEALFRFVAEDIRYVSLSTEGHTHTPHTNDSVIRNRYGDCKDKTALLQALLALEGVEATPVLVSTNRTDPDRLVLPSLNYFNHIVLCLAYQGQRYCLDPTDSTVHWQSTSNWIQGKVALPLTSTTKPEQIPAEKHRWTMDILSELVFTEAGGLHEVQTRTYSDAFAAYMREQLRGSDTDEQQQMLVRQYQQVVADTDNVSAMALAGTQREDDYRQLQVRTEANYSAFATTDNHLRYTEDDAWLVDDLQSSYLDNEYDAVTLDGVRYRSRYNVDVTAHWRVMSPAPTVELVHRFGSFKRVSKILNDGRLSIETILEIPHQTIGLTEQDEFNQLLDRFLALQTIRIEAPFSADSANP